MFKIQEKAEAEKFRRKVHFGNYFETLKKFHLRNSIYFLEEKFLMVFRVFYRPVIDDVFPSKVYLMFYKIRTLVKETEFYLNFRSFL